jgi:chromosome segregation ATPase
VSIPGRLLVATLVVAAVSCGPSPATDGAELAALREEIAALRADEQVVLGRIEALEAELEGLREPAADPERERFEGALDDLDLALADLRAAVAAETAARTELGEDLDGRSRDLRASVTRMQGAVDDLAGQVDELRTLYTTLRDRIDRLQQR